MKRNKTILIAILVALLAVYLVLRLKGPEERLRPVYDLDSLSIESIEVFDQANTLKFTKNKGVWYLTEPVKWPADTLRINALFRNVFTAKYSRTPMGEGLQALKRFELQDSTALHIVVGGKGKKIHTMFSNMAIPTTTSAIMAQTRFIRSKPRFTTSLEPTCQTGVRPMW